MQFLLVIRSNLRLISHRFRDMTNDIPYSILLPVFR